MKDYHINIFPSDEDGGYIADISDLHHCSAFGDTPELALATIESVVVLGALHASPAVKAALVGRIV